MLIPLNPWEARAVSSFPHQSHQRNFQCIKLNQLSSSSLRILMSLFYIHTVESVEMKMRSIWAKWIQSWSAMVILSRLNSWIYYFDLTEDCSSEYLANVQLHWWYSKEHCFYMYLMQVHLMHIIVYSTMWRSSEFNQLTIGWLLWG